MPKIDFVNGIVKYKPNQTGIHRVRNEIKSKYKINANGWNSSYEEYQLNKSEDIYRIAVIGDSYVEARQVNFDESLAEQLERRLGKDRFQVYRFGIGGAPLSQYLHMLRNEILDFQPDLIIVLLYHNDFSQSHLFAPGMYTSSFMKIDIENDVVVKEIEPRELEKKWLFAIREKSAIWKFLAYRQQIQFTALRNYFFKQQADSSGESDTNDANITQTKKKYQLHNEIATKYLLTQLKNTCHASNSDLLIAMDGVRFIIYREFDPSDDPQYLSDNLVLNTMVERVTDSLDIHFVDLHHAFKNEYARNRKKFNFENDYHWNTYGHEFASKIIFEYMAKTLLPENN